MQFLGFPPRTAVAVFAKVFDHQANILKVPDAGLRVPKPETLRVSPDQRPRVLDQLRWRRRRGGKIMQGIRPITHGATLRVLPVDRKNGGWPWLEPARRTASKGSRNRQARGARRMSSSTRARGSTRSPRSRSPGWTGSSRSPTPVLSSSPSPRIRSRIELVEGLFEEGKV